jgi:alanyl-tRNA synthetase
MEGFREAFEKHRELSRKGAEQKFKGGLADHSDLVTRLPHGHPPAARRP